MAIKTKNQPDTFVSGRGNVSGNVAKSNEESEIMQDGMEAVPSDAGAKPVFATGETAFHTGRGSGRGHGPDSND